MVSLQIVAYDFGIKHNILRRLASFGAKVTVVPANYPAEKAMELQPDGVFFSNGPVSSHLPLTAQHMSLVQDHLFLDTASGMHQLKLFLSKQHLNINGSHNYWCEVRRKWGIRFDLISITGCWNTYVEFSKFPKQTPRHWSDVARLGELALLITEEPSICRVTRQQCPMPLRLQKRSLVRCLHLEFVWATKWWDKLLEQTLSSSSLVIMEAITPSDSQRQVCFILLFQPPFFLALHDYSTVLWYLCFILCMPMAAFWAQKMKLIL